MGLTFISGGVRSGKSSYGEKLAISYAKKMYYVATALNSDSEMEKRINKHIKDRENFEFNTIEVTNSLNALFDIHNSTILIDCLTNLVSNNLFNFNKTKAQVMELVRQIPKLVEKNNNIIVVSNDVFSNGSNYAGYTDLFLQTLGEAHQFLTECCDNAYESVYGIALKRK